jgi:hypothetical protein
MVSERLFQKMDRARLDSATLNAAMPDLMSVLVEVVRARESYVADGGVRALHLTFQQVVDVLDGCFGLPTKRVFLRDRPRPHRRSQGRVVYEVHGECDPDGPMEIYTRTAAYARPVALKSLLDTLLHEWIHHYDFTRFGDSLHCDGFFERLAQVYRPMRDRLDKLSELARTDRDQSA